MGIRQEILTEASNLDTELYTRRNELKLLKQSELWEERGRQAGRLHDAVTNDPRAIKIDSEPIGVHIYPLDVRQVSLFTGESRTPVTLRSSKEVGLYGFTVTIVVFVDDGAADEVIEGSTSSGRGDGPRLPDASFDDMANVLEDTLVIEAFHRELLLQVQESIFQEPVNTQIGA